MNLKYLELVLITFVDVVVECGMVYENWNCFDLESLVMTSKEFRIDDVLIYILMVWMRELYIYPMVFG